MASTQQRQAAARLAKRQAKSADARMAYLRSFAEKFAKDAKIDPVQFACFEPAACINFFSINDGYDDFIEAMRGIGFDWSQYRTHGGSVHATVVLSETSVITACIGDFPASTVCENGDELNEFAVGAGYYTIIEQAMRSFKSQLNGKALCVPMMTLLPNGRLNIVVMAA